MELEFYFRNCVDIFLVEMGWIEESILEEASSVFPSALKAIHFSWMERSQFCLSESWLFAYLESS